jgi:hypothetical protein
MSLVPLSKEEQVQLHFVRVAGTGHADTRESRLDRESLNGLASLASDLKDSGL